MSAQFLLRCKHCLELVDPYEGWAVRAHVASCRHNSFEPVPVDPVTGRALEDADGGMTFTGAPHPIDHGGLDRLRALQRKRWSQP